MTLYRCTRCEMLKRTPVGDGKHCTDCGNRFFAAYQECSTGYTPAPGLDYTEAPLALPKENDAYPDHRLDALKYGLTSVRDLLEKRKGVTFPVADPLRLDGIYGIKWITTNFDGIGKHARDPEFEDSEEYRGEELDCAGCNKKVFEDDCIQIIYPGDGDKAEYDYFGYCCSKDLLIDISYRKKFPPKGK